jgi:hypothetical protein
MFVHLCITKLITQIESILTQFEKLAILTMLESVLYAEMYILYCGVNISVKLL